MLPYRLTVLGPPELRGPDGDPLRFRTRKHLGLLVFLALQPGHPHRRDRLATLLWSSADLDEARHSLATALSVLRGRIGTDAIEATRETIRLVPGRVLTDLPALDADALDDPDLAPIGPFLDEFEILDAPEFQRWRDGQQARLLPALCGCLVRRIERCRRTGDARRMEALAHQLHRIDGLAEEGARALIEARALAGDRIGALRIYDRWKLELAEELGAVPSAELSRMADRLRRRGLDQPTAMPLAPVPTEHWKERVFVGRGAEYAACYAAWQRVRGGEPRHVLVRGESGLGKTTLVERLVTSVALEGASVARVPCYELERELPFGVVGTLVAQLLDLPGASATPPEQLAELGRLVAKVRQRWPTLPAPLPTVGESARIQFSEAVLELITSLAAEQPLALVVDDIHLADATSLAVLHLLLRRIEAMPVMVLLTSSSRLEDEAPPARRFADNAESLGLLQVGLGPLPAVHAAELLEALLQRDPEPGPTVRRALLAGASGNPMVLELLVGDWRRRGDASLALSLGAMTAGSAGPPKEAFRRVVDGTLAALDGEARAVVELGAILGQRLNDLSMYTLVDLPVARTMRAMTALTAHRVLRDAGSHLEFANEYMRGQCYVAMPAPLRRMLHSLVADRLLAEDGADEPIPGLEVAWHLVRGDRLAEAVPYLLAGGRESIRRGAPHEADLALTTGLPALTGAPRRTAILLLAEARQELGRWADSLRVLDTPADPYDASEECCREVLRIIGRRWSGNLPIKELVAATHQLCDIAEREIDVEVRVKALSAVPYLQTQTRDSTALLRMGSALVAVQSQSMDAYQRLHLLMASAWWHDQKRELPTAIALVDQAMAVIEETGFASSVTVRLVVGAGALHIQLGEYTEAIAKFERAVRMAKKIDNPVHLSGARAGLAMGLGRLGRYQEQLDEARAAMKCLGPEEWGIVALSACYESALAYVMLGRDAEAVTFLYGNDSRFKGGCPPWTRQAWQLMKADILLMAGESRRAFANARKALALSPDAPLVGDFSGLHARWTALVGRQDNNKVAAARVIEDMLSNPDTLHAKDRAEAMASLLMVTRESGRDNYSELVDETSKQIRAMPASVTRILQRLGLWPDDELKRGSWGVK